MQALNCLLKADDTFINKTEKKQIKKLTHHLTKGFQLKHNYKLDISYLLLCLQFFTSINDSSLFNESFTRVISRIYFYKYRMSGG